MSDAGSRITACVIARDEAPNLAALLPGLTWAHEILVVVDEASTDGSAALAASLGARAVQRFASFAQFRNGALELAQSPWVFFVDADERVSTTLAAEVQASVRREGDTIAATDRTPVAGFWIPRRNVILGRVIRGGGWWPDYQLRLLQRGRARYDETRPVHEVVVLDGPDGHLTESLLHYNYESVRQFFEKQRRYTRMEAAAIVAQGSPPRRRALVGTPAREFKRRYIDLRGWTDGPLGLFLGAAMAYFAFERVRLARAGGESQGIGR